MCHILLKSESTKNIENDSSTIGYFSFDDNNVAMTKWHKIKRNKHLMERKKSNEKSKWEKNETNDLATTTTKIVKSKTTAMLWYILRITIYGTNIKYSNRMFHWYFTRKILMWCRYRYWLHWRQAARQPGNRVGCCDFLFCFFFTAVVCRCLILCIPWLCACVCLCKHFASVRTRAQTKGVRLA